MGTKIAVFVEGQSELIFVRDFLLKWYQYDSSVIAVACCSLRSDVGRPVDVPFNYGERDSAEFFYDIINVGSDERVMSVMVNTAGRYRNLGYSRLIGLSDMYTERYHEMSRRHISAELNLKFINGANSTLAARGLSDFAKYHYAIMEFEAWVLGFYWRMCAVDPALTEEALSDGWGVTESFDPETGVYHPYKMLADVYSSVGLAYGKHSGDVESFVSGLDRTDFEMLASSDNCRSFAMFMDSLLLRS